MEEVLIKRGETKMNSNDGHDISIIEKLTIINRESTKAEFNDLPLSDDCERGLTYIPQEILKEIENYCLESFYQSNLAERTSFFKKIPKEQIMKWSSDLISKPLTKLPSNISDFALQLYKSLLSYLGERKSSKTPLEHIKKHLKFSMVSPIELKDEAYIQILKQLNDNPNYDKIMRVWMFFSIMASCYAPSVELFYSILRFLVDLIKSSLDKNIVKRANYIIRRLMRSFENKRRYIPSDEEILHIESMKPIMFPVYFFSKTYTLVPTESYSTIKELKVSIMRKLRFNISKTPYYCFYEICERKDILEERFLDDCDLLVDIIAELELDKNANPSDFFGFRLYLKVQFFYEYSEEDVDSITMFYVQNLYEVISGRFFLSDQEVIVLASLQLLINYQVAHEIAYQALQKDLDNYVPQDFIDKHSCAFWIQRIMELYSGLRTSSLTEAKLTYLEQLKGNPFWQSHQFNVKYSSKFNQNRRFPDDCILAIKPKEITIFDSNKNLLDNIPYPHIISWGVSSDILVIVLSREEGELIKHYFESNQTKILHYLIGSYTNLLVGSSFEEVAKSINSIAIKNKTSNKLIKYTKTSERSRVSTFYKKMKRKIFYDV